MLLLLVFSACTLEDELVMTFPQVPESLFVEAYLAPGAPLRLTLARTNSLQEALLPEPIANASVVVSLPEGDIVLENKLVKDAKSGKVYNYTSPYVLPAGLVADSIRLQITTTAAKEVLYATTALVEPVSIRDWSLQEQRLRVVCNNGSDMQNRYYGLFLQSRNENETVIRTVHYDYSQVDEQELTMSVLIPEGETLRRFILYRITEENYLFQVALKKAVNTTTDPFEAPLVVPGNIKGGQGMFTYFTADTLIF